MAEETSNTRLTPERQNQLWGKCGGAVNQIRSIFRETFGQIARMIPPEERGGIADQTEYESLTLVVCGADKNAIRLKMRSGENAFYEISVGKIEVLTPKRKGYANKDVVRVTDGSVVVNRQSRLPAIFPEIPPSNVQLISGFKQEKTFYLSFGKIEFPRNLSPDELPNALAEILRSTRDRISQDGLLAFVANKTAETEDTTTLGGLLALVASPVATRR